MVISMILKDFEPSEKLRHIVKNYVLLHYDDYQHMAKDFKQFAGTTPNSLLQAQNNTPERILGLEEFWV